MFAALSSNLKADPTFPAEFNPGYTSQVLSDLSMKFLQKPDEFLVRDGVPCECDCEKRIGSFTTDNSGNIHLNTTGLYTKIVDDPILVDIRKNFNNNLPTPHRPLPNGFQSLFLNVASCVEGTEYIRITFPSTYDAGTGTGINEPGYLYVTNITNPGFSYSPYPLSPINNNLNNFNNTTYEIEIATQGCKDINLRLDFYTSSSGMFNLKSHTIDLKIEIFIKDANGRIVPKCTVNRKLVTEGPVEKKLAEPLMNEVSNEIINSPIFDKNQSINLNRPNNFEPSNWNYSIENVQGIIISEGSTNGSIISIDAITIPGTYLLIQKQGEIIKRSKFLVK